MKIGILTATYLPYQEYGAERAVRMLAGGLVRRGHEVRVVTTCPAGEDRVERIDNHDVAYLSQRNGYWSGDRATKSTLEKVMWHARDTFNRSMREAVGLVLDAWTPDVVHTNILAGFSVAAWDAVKSRGIPLVHTLHDYYLLCPKSSMFVGNAACGSQCLPCRVFAAPRCRATRLVDAVNAPSKAVLDAHMNRGLFQRAVTREVVHCISPYPETEFPGGGKRSVVIGYLGRLSEDKGVGRLLQWFAGPEARQLGDVRLLVAGAGPLERELRAAATDPRIEYLGYTTPDAFFSRITALVVPSIWHDPSPVVIREAYARGVPVAGSTFGGIPELIRLVDDRLIFDPFVPGDMMKAIRLATSEEAGPRLKTRCIEAAREFTEAAVCEQMERVYRSLHESPHQSGSLGTGPN